ncbi:MAG: hypothetical protein WCG47_00740 [Dermatophilaceae bacterium]
MAVLDHLAAAGELLVTTKPDPTFLQEDHMDLQGAPTETVSVARMLIDAGWLHTPADVVDFFSKPHKWQPEADTWRNCGSPDPDTNGWALFVARLDKLDARRDS